jgi:altronate dehydratase small subunit
MTFTQTAPSAFQVAASDNVATLLGEATQGDFVTVVGPAGKREITAREKIELGHKIALKPINKDEAVIKFGVVIGIAMHHIESGEWVHLQNCRSQLDERSGHFDVHTGEPGDNPYE